MADTAVKAGAGQSDWGYYEFVKGFAEYRQGHFGDAIEWLKKVVPPNEQEFAAVRVLPACRVEAYVTLSMAHYQLRQFDAARASLTKGENFAEARMTNPNDFTWNDQIIARLLMREAKNLITDSNLAPQGQ
jgi:hypothetical protein